MTIKPLKHYQEPKYATYDYFLSHPELLNRVPERWRKNAFVLAAASVFTMIIGNCGREVPATGGSPTMPPPLTETEAQQIIRDEAVRSGITFVNDSLTIANFQVPLHLYPSQVDTVRYTLPFSLVLDGRDPTRQITYEYISQEDLSAWRYLDTSSTYLSIDNAKTARDLQNKLRQERPDLHSGVFYDPGSGYGNPPDEYMLRQQVNDFILWLRSQGIL